MTSAQKYARIASRFDILCANRQRDNGIQKRRIKPRIVKGTHILVSIVKEKNVFLTHVSQLRRFFGIFQFRFKMPEIEK